MFNVGGGELIVIMLIALIVLGPSRLPDAARTIGKTLSDLRRLSTSFQNEVRTALDTADDPNQVASRRNVLATEEVATEDVATDPEPHPARTEPLVAAPVPPDPDPADSPSKPSPAKASKAPAKTTRAKTADDDAAPKNGTAVEKSTSSKAAPRRAKG